MIPMAMALGLVTFFQLVRSAESFQAPSASVVLSASPTEDPEARNMFYAPEAPPPGFNSGQAATPPLVPATPLGLRYRILLKDRDRIRQVNFHSFRGGQQIRLILSSNTTGYLYIVEHGSKGTRRLLYPDPRINLGQNLVGAFQEYEVPANGFFAFDETTGKETLNIFFSPTPLAEFQLGTLDQGIIPPVQWVPIQNLVDRQKAQCLRTLKFHDGGVPVDLPVDPPEPVGLVPQVYVTQYAPLLFQEIVFNHYR
jgi:hypothetical protein